MSSEINNLYEFGSFRLDTETNTLWRENELISLSPKAFELLRVIVEGQGEIISKQEIFDKVWAGTFVEEGVLTQNIYTLRQTLGTNENGKHIIENIARRGYRVSVPISAKAKLKEIHDKHILNVILDEQEIIDEISTKNISRKKPFYRRKSTIFLSFGLIMVLFLAFFGFRVFRGQIWAWFHPPLENVQFQKVTDSGQTKHPTLSPDGNFMAYVRDKAIFLKDLASGKEIKLEIPTIESFSSLQFSPNGESIFFRNSETLRKNANILQVSRFGGEIKLIAEKSWCGFGLSPDGKQIAFIRKFTDSRKEILYLKNLENGEEKELLTREFPDFFHYRGTLSWSPDASKIAFTANAGTERATKLFVIDTKTGAETEMKSARLRSFEQAVWTVDGETLIAAASEIGRKFHLWKIFYPSGNAQRITNGLNNFGSISISADGKKLLSVQTSENSNIWISGEKDLSNQTQITKGNSNNVGQTSLNWLNNEKLVYATTEETNAFSNLLILNTADNSRQPLTANTNFHSDFASVSGNGKYVYFNANRNRLINIWRMETNGENLTQITNATDGMQLFPNVSPDGKFLYFLFRNRETAVVKRLNLVENKEEIFFESKTVVPASFLSISPDGKFLAFLNLNNGIEADDEENNFQFAVLSTENANDIRFFNVKTFGQTARFSPDVKFLDYISFGENETKILRQNLDGGEPKEIFTLPKERIFNFAWSNDGKKLAVSRGQQYRDAVLLTNFE